jgi:mannosyl-oligosaccharide alpha-1,3-glucosidase
MILSSAISGFSFGGADVPGFSGNPSDDLFVKFYQLGAWFPFFRAHSHIDYKKREPWLQSQRVQRVIRSAIN